ncbi:glycosyltransferase family 2 protein [Flavobacteriales bacterium]|nr:glycosyltransferase family 2 protein [Flavobacteriales bacterium]
MSNAPCASVVIPCLNEADYIGPCLTALERQEGLPGEIQVLVVDGGSDDGTLEVLEEKMALNPAWRLLNNPARVTPVAMNLGIQAAASDVLIILGAHSEVASDFVRRNLEGLRSHPECGCVGGVVEQVHGDNKSRRIGLAMSSPFGVGNARFRTGGLAGHVDTVAFGAYRMSVLSEIGGVDESLVRNQDDELNYRLTESGWRIWFDSRIRSTYHARSSYRRLFKQYRQYGYWKVFVNQKHRTVTTWRQLVPAAFLFSLAVFGGLALIGEGLSPESVWAKLSQQTTVLIAVSWLLGAIGAMVLSAIRPKDMWGVFRGFAVLHLAYGWGYWQGIWRFIVLRQRPSSLSKVLTR